MHIPHIFHITISRSHAPGRPSEMRWWWNIAVGYFGFAARALRELFHLPLDSEEISHQFYTIGWRSTPLIVGTGAVLGIALAELIWRSLVNLGAGDAVIPGELSRMMFRQMGPIMTGLLVAGRVGSAIGAEVAVLRLTDQIDALESLGIDSFRYLVATRVAACVVAMPLLAILMSFSEIAGGYVWEAVHSEMSLSLYAYRIFDKVGWGDYILPLILTAIDGFVVGTISSYFGYTVNESAAAVRRASTYSVVLSCLVVVAASLLFNQVIPFWSLGGRR